MKEIYNQIYLYFICFLKFECGFFLNAQHCLVTMVEKCSEDQLVEVVTQVLF